MLIKLFRILPHLFIQTILLSCIETHARDQATHLCTHQCNTPLSNSSYLHEWCEEEGFNISGRCCIDHTNASVVGVSLSDCDINSLSDLLQGFTNLGVVLLDHNDLTNTTTEPEQFRGLIHLNYLTLPASVSCPGGYDAWDIVQYDSNLTLCENRTNLCIVLSNLTCATNSHCVDGGPGLRECLCTDDHHGYKCLRTGQFPIVLFCSLTGALTVFFCVFLWCTQRRHVKKD